MQAKCDVTGNNAWVKGQVIVWPQGEGHFLKGMISRYTCYSCKYLKIFPVMPMFNVQNIMQNIVRNKMIHSMWGFISFYWCYDLINTFLSSFPSNINHELCNNTLIKVSQSTKISQICLKSTIFNLNMEELARDNHKLIILLTDLCV